MPAGAPTKYDGEATCKLVKLLGEAGATHDQIAHVLEVHIDTLQEWDRVHPEFSVVLKLARTFSDNKIVASLFNRASGMKKTVQRLNRQGEPIDCIEEIPPDPASMIFWLKNRQRDLWKDRHDVEHGGVISVAPVINLSSSVKTIEVLSIPSIEAIAIGEEKE